MKALVHAKHLLSPEFRLVAACAWLEERNWPVQREAVLALLGTGVDPAEFQSLIKRHRVAALAYTVLSRAIADSGTELEWLSRLRPAANRTRLQSLSLHGDWQRIEKLCRNAAIGVRTLKGTALSARLYDDVGIRHSRDIDLLVRPHDLERLLELLRASGYEVDSVFQPHRRRRLALHIFHMLKYHATCKSPAGSTIEVHSHIERPLNSEIDAVWAKIAWNPERRTQSQFDLLYCTLHGSVHGWSRLKWLGDVSTMACRLAPSEWPDVIALAAELRLTSLLAGALLLIQWILDFPLPEAAAGLVRASGEASYRLAEQAMKWLLMPETELNRFTVMNKFRRWQLSCSVERRLPIRERGLYWLTKLMFSPTDLITIKLPMPLFVLYPLIRPVSSLHRSLVEAASKRR